ncbi:hypothetical protein [Stutzerimonas stutzeri]|uniref:hypothetical protein n=1 Tax=Stutzerimonas stutzeri TaxID=316 RepID=UPI00244AFB73|nr:hypothetical protein [Stutzerimonas stutzeri]MDH1587976.1 hypothetical protein [Stutzerimonas stutzeri]
MAAPKLTTNLGYYLPEKAYWHLEQVHASLRLLEYLAGDSRPKATIEVDVLAQHLALINEQLASVIKQAGWDGKGA